MKDNDPMIMGNSVTQPKQNNAEQNRMSILQDILWVSFEVMWDDRLSPEIVNICHSELTYWITKSKANGSTKY